VFSDEAVNCYGLDIVAKNLITCGKREVPLAEAEVLLYSFYWPEQLYEFVRWKRQNAQALEGKIIVAGGNAATTNPASILPFVDYVFCGDGDEWDGDLSSKHLTDGTRTATICCMDPIRPALYVETKRHRTTFVEISRGCKNKCLFCQYSWLKPYRECNIYDIAAALENRQTKAARIFSADRMQHSRFPEIRKITRHLGIQDLSADVSLKFLARNKEAIGYINKIRTGLDGLSERLRRQVSKPLNNEAIICTMAHAVKSGIKCFDWYMIYGYPDETEADVDEFCGLLEQLGPVMRDKTLAIHWNAFQPNALTPMQWCSPLWPYPQQWLTKVNTVRWADGKIMHKPLRTNDETLVRRLLATRGTRETAKLIEAYAVSAKLRSSTPAILKQYRKITGRELMGPWPVSEPMPWDGLVDYPRDKMLAVYKKRFFQHGGHEPGSKDGRERMSTKKPRP